MLSNNPTNSRIRLMLGDFKQFRREPFEMSIRQLIHRLGCFERAIFKIPAYTLQGANGLYETIKIIL